VESNALFEQIQLYMQEKYQQAGKVFSISSAYGQIIHALSQISNMILFYIEDAITELNIYSASRTSSIQGLARLAGHNITRSISSTGEVQISLISNPQVNGNQILIPRYTRLRCINNSVTYLINFPESDIRIPFGSKVPVYSAVIQGELQNQVYTANGEILQSYSIQERSFNFIENFFTKVYVNGVEWKKYDSLYDIPKDYEGFVAKTGISGGLDIYFGNGAFGKVPTLGSSITIEYIRSAGSGGNLREGQEVYFQWLDSGYSVFGEEIDLNEITTVKMSKVISFGANSEDIELTKLLAPKTSRSYVFATPENYRVFLEKFNYFSVIDAFTTYDDQYLDDDNIIYLFLIPDITKRMTDGENYFTVPITFFTLTEQEQEKVVNLIEDSGSKIVTTVVKILDPIITKYVLNVSLVTYEGYSTMSIREKVVQAVSDYFLQNKRTDRIPKSDLIRVIEAVEGVDSVNVSFISELNEQKLNSTDPLIGLDEFGDIIIGRDELPLIRGGWKDKNGLYYEDGLSTDKPCSLNISFKKVSVKQ
jgi:hypothetical protein